MEHDERLMDYNPTLLASSFSPPKNLNDYAHLEKKILIHQLPLQQQKIMLMKALIFNDNHYIYEFDKESLSVRAKVLSKYMALILTGFGYYSFSTYFYYKRIKTRKIRIKKEFKAFFLLMVNVLPLFYFYYEGYRIYYNFDEYLYKKYLAK